MCDMLERGLCAIAMQTLTEALSEKLNFKFDDYVGKSDVAAYQRLIDDYWLSAMSKVIVYALLRRQWAMMELEWNDEEYVEEFTEEDVEHDGNSKHFL